MSDGEAVQSVDTGARSTPGLPLHVLLCGINTSIRPCLILMSGALVLLFARFDRQRQTVLRWRQWTGCVGSECAGRVFGLVEVENDSPVFLGRFRVQKAGCSIRCFSAC